MQFDKDQFSYNIIKNKHFLLREEDFIKKNDYIEMIVEIIEDNSLHIK